MAEQTKRPPEGGLHVSIWRDQIAAAFALLRRRYVRKPTPKKPSIIIAQVEGSGTAGETAMLSAIDVGVNRINSPSSLIVPVAGITVPPGSGMAV